MSSAPAQGRAVRALRLGIGFVLFQVAWFCCVASAARGHAGLGIAAVAVVIPILLAMSTNRRADMQLIGLALAIGFAWDSFMAGNGIIDYASPQPVRGFAPAWILAMWMLLAPMLREPLRWMHDRPLFAAAAGGLGGALSYAAASRLGACRFPEPLVAYLALGTGWALIMPILLAAAKHSDRRTPGSEERA